MSAPALLTLRGLTRRHGETPVFAGIDLDLQPGEVVALIGESGVGKSTLLNCIAGLDRPDAGEVRIDGRAVAQLSEPQAAALRRDRLGFVFQAFHVLPHLSVADNVALPLRLQGTLAEPELAQRTRAMLAEVGLDGLGERRPRTLSGGQLQRVAIARALVHRPALILADEPTGNLDPATAERVLDLLIHQARTHGAGCLIVTHALAGARRADRCLRLTPTGVLPQDLPG
ncbi:putative ABC transport system ATP-binding protein [Sphaerotilus hippei]|uniref:Putative ABC transport system ATP-binding protein n=1 Tax=Sphaerotilus hippei TaxID=744406 RepID=A0A318H945_9BURK|nr:ABC transporter ATP-binding protein [Sphaerotilus hippei]PXW96607.1 putative ABC transport system ATP-binding protein [Sphaerotilus hippei]